MDKSYYAIIPASVRYDEKLCPNAKLLYGEITALCNEKGYCWASNLYFANLYKVSGRSIINWINELEQNGHIIVKYEDYSITGGSITEKYNTKRYIMLSKNIPLLKLGVKKSSQGSEKNFHSSEEIFMGGVKKFSP